MKRIIQNIFVVTALIITCTPAIQCTKENLAGYVAQANVTEFKKAYDILMQSDATAEERATIAQELTTTIQEAKQQLQTLLNDNNLQTNKTMLAKGAAQSVGGAIFLISAACSTTILYKSKILNLNDYSDWHGTSLCIKVRDTIPFIWIAKASNKIYNAIAGKRVFIPLSIALILARIAPGAYGMKSGIQNCKDGWNYKAYLAQQIKNLDEIVAHIQAK